MTLMVRDVTRNMSTDPLAMLYFGESKCSAAVKAVGLRSNIVASCEIHGTTVSNFQLPRVEPVVEIKHTTHIVC